MSSILKNIQIYDTKPNTITGGTLYTAEVKIETLKEEQNRLVRIYLPSNYNFKKPSLRFPVIYMFDGKNLFDKYTSFLGEWEVDEVIEQRNKQHKQTYIIVGIDSASSNVGRIEEMLPSNNNLTGIDNLPNNLWAGGELLSQFIVNKLKPEIDKLFYTIPSKCATAIAGSSMGGLLSFYMGIKYREIFGMSFCFSPAFCLYEDSYFINKLINSSINTNSLGKIYLLVGNVEYENQFVKLTKKTYDILLNKGMNLKQIKLVHDNEGIHHESFWNKYFNDAIEFWCEK